jgi:hypothetical protein
MKDVEDHVSIIQQNPVALSFTFDPLGTDSCFFQKFDDTLCNPSAMDVGSSFTD